MIEGIEPLYQQIAEAIQEAIPEEWSSAKMEVIFYPQSSIYLGEYTRKADGVARDFATTTNAERAFRKIRRRFREAGKPLWCQATFELKPEGKFNMKWEYDGCDENGFAPFNEEEVLKRHEERHRRLSAK